ncbi:MAG: Cof-type HAD-IIB family hydrolase [Ruminococcus sp.]|nr:Cof-type HAD-IIB family hydrolase [Ruminococcus sp.]
MKKIIFFDVDGTLVTEDEYARIPESTVRAIKKARENGHLTFINTGRTIFNLSDELKEIGFDGYVCGCGTYIEYNGEVLVHNKLEKSRCIEISTLLRKHNAPPVYERSDCLFFDSNFNDTKEIRYFKEVFLSQGVDTTHTTDDEDFSFDKFVFWCNDENSFEAIKDEIEKDFMIIDRGEGFYENVPKGYTKATAIELLLVKLNIPLENSYAVGDSPNDLPMLKAVPNSIAMGGAERIYPYVSYITKPIEEDGIEYALKHFGII